LKDFCGRPGSKAAQPCSGRRCGDEFSTNDWRFASSRPKTPSKSQDIRQSEIRSETAVDVQEVRKLDAYLKRLFGNPKIRVVPRPKKDDSAEVYIGEEFIGVLFVDDEDDDRSFQFQMAILEDDLVEQD
jgi:hypothetical protein